MASTHSGTAQKVDDMLRIWWTTCSGFSGRHAPDYAVETDYSIYSSDMYENDVDSDIDAFSALFG